MDDIALMQEIAEALGKELLGRPVPQMGISTTASAPGSDPGDSSSKSRIPCHFGGWPGRVSRPLKPCCSVRTPKSASTRHRLPARPPLSQGGRVGFDPHWRDQLEGVGQLRTGTACGLKPRPFAGSTPAVLTIWDRGLVGKGTPCRLRTGGFPSSKSRRSYQFRSVPAEWSATGPENQDGCLQGQGVRFLSAPPIVDGAGVGSPSGLLNRSGLTGSEVRCLRCPPASFCQWQATSLVRRQRSFDPTRKHQFRGSVTRGARDVGCNPIAERRAVQLSLSPPLPVSSKGRIAAR